MGLKEMRAELRQLRKNLPEHTPISKLKKADVASQLEKLKQMREETPAPAATPSTASKRKMISAVETVSQAKKMEFPQKPGVDTKKSSGSATKESTSREKKKSKLDRLMELVDSMSDDDE